MSTNCYWNEIAKIPGLSKEQEYNIAKNIWQYRKKIEAIEKILKKSNTPKRDAQALMKKIASYKKSFEEYKNQMIRGNFKLVISIAKKYNSRNLDFIDLVEEGNIGLMKATDKFDYKKGVRFSTFATWWIRQAINSFVKNKGRMIRIPIHIDTELRRIKKEITKYKNETGHKPNVKQLVEFTGIKEKKINLILDVPQETLSLDTPLNDSNQELLDTLIDPSEIYQPESNILKYSLKGLLKKAFASLSEIENKILVMRFGLGKEKPMVLSEIGHTMGMTRERVRQIEGNAIKKLKHSTYSDYLKCFIA